MKNRRARLFAGTAVSFIFACERSYIHHRSDIRAGVIAPRQKTLHFILVQIACADIGIQILIEIIMHTALTIGHDLLFGKLSVFRRPHLPRIHCVLW